MIYFAWIVIFILAVLKGESELLTNDAGWMFLACVGILPIWWGIRECVRELEKIRKLMEKAIGGKEDAE